MAKDAVQIDRDYVPSHQRGGWGAGQRKRKDGEELGAACLRALRVSKFATFALDSEPEATKDGENQQEASGTRPFNSVPSGTQTTPLVLSPSRS